MTCTQTGTDEYSDLHQIAHRFNARRCGGRLWYHRTAWRYFCVSLEHNLTVYWCLGDARLAKQLSHNDFSSLHKVPWLQLAIPPSTPSFGHGIEDEHHEWQVCIGFPHGLTPHVVGGSLGPLSVFIAFL